LTNATVGKARSSKWDVATGATSKAASSWIADVEGGRRHSGEFNSASSEAREVAWECGRRGIPERAVIALMLNQ
jgi:hypothetical protein